MLKKTIYRLLRHRHFWREVGFDELSELYVSMMFRGLSISLTGLFVPIYMLRLHYSLAAICSVIAWYFTFRFLIFDLLSGYTVAKFGPKHTMLVGYVFLIASTAMFLTLPHYGWPIWLLGGIWGGSASFFFIPFNVDFSKVKHAQHGGKELGYINMMEKLGTALGPLVGGLVATIFGAQYIFFVAIILLTIGVIPLFRSDEPVRINQRLDFKSLKANDLLHDYVSVASVGIENTLSMFFWPLYLGVFVLVGTSAYAKLGILASVSVMIAVITAHTIGKMIDRHRGRTLLRYNAGLNALLHLLRPLILSYPVAFAANMANETVTIGYRMPYYKGLFDAADGLPGHRIVYLTSIEWIGSVCKGTVWWLLVLLSTTINPRAFFAVGFLVAAAASIGIMSERFKALDPRHRAYNVG